MAIFQGKQWFRDNLAPYLTVIKAELSSISNVTGQFVGSATTFATLPALDQQGNAVADGDWSILSADNIGTGSAASPQYPAGIYVLGGGVFTLAQENQDIADVLDVIIATPAEVTTGTLNGKVASVRDLALQYAKLNGSNAELFLVADGNYDTKEAVNGSQFNSTSINGTEASTDYAAA